MIRNTWVLLGLLSRLAHALPATVVSNKQLLSSYDYVIAGGGTSGLTVANRLTEDPAVTVLVIEVGQLDQGEPGVVVPGIPPPDKYKRDYTSTPQAGLLNRTSQLYTAEVVGGGTVINGMFFNRGSAEDYDAWEQLGNPGWGWEGLLPYFKKSETYTPAIQQVQDVFPSSPDLGPHGFDGPVGSSYPPYYFKASKNFYAAWQSLGVALNPQSNAGKAIGAFYSPMSLMSWNMSRATASSAYYKGEPSTRPNLHLLTGHRVGRILIKGKRACGIEYAAVNSTAASRVTATHEVIVAAGTQRSPQLLHLSGIGPASLLFSLNISIVEDLPGVGYNFQDQPNYFFFLAYTNLTTPTPAWMNTESGDHTSWAKEQLALYYSKRLGAYTTTYNGGPTVAFLPLRNITSSYATLAATVNSPDFKDSSIPNTVQLGYNAQRQLLSTHYLSRNTATTETAWSAGSSALIIVLLKPLSRGSILINSTSASSDPVIDFGTFTHPTDLSILTASFYQHRQWLATPAMQELGAFETSPGEAVQSVGDVETALRNGTLSSWQHPVGTCAMMPRKLGGVVDSELRVYGVERLRVVDASVMPIIPASHTSSTVYAVAEKAADLIKAAWRPRDGREG
ncbi:hypothetical protein DOTSEDRAFT_63380 [Dothistroma septosporum NZE10]|uniref:Glucose-methanol-choline oxidoreductase N-terminal domain-containing protein n=1 Tax=Dothistroma septosporum (strain NZE10 / CBS 128990) TaxID=675120 RepID=M2YM59_DOTSN|nr:hypothetical protein DOTSEDRAFT_63380 [Dothistroma septosporum NZE10]